MKLLLIAGALVGMSCARIIHHDEQMAARDAETFIRLALLCNNATQAYYNTDPEFQKYNNFAKFQELLTEMHPKGFPASLLISNYEPMPGKESMNLFIDGDNGPQAFHYRLVMIGTQSIGYKVGGIFRGNGKYPDSKLRHPLTMTISLKNGC